MKGLLNFFIIIVLIIVFLCQSFLIVDKYIKSKTTKEDILQDDGEVLFPSITFCKKYVYDIFPGIIQVIKENESITEEDAKIWVKKNVWKRNDMFVFFNHQNIKNFSYPCNTVGGDDAGKPCSFPFR